MGVWSQGGVWARDYDLACVFVTVIASRVLRTHSWSNYPWVTTIHGYVYKNEFYLETSSSILASFPNILFRHVFPIFIIFCHIFSLSHGFKPFFKADGIA